jgi:hypothetical protein
VHPLDRSLTTPRRVYDFLTFAWVNPLMRRGAQAQLKPQDLFPVPFHEESYNLTSTLETAWHGQLALPGGSLFTAYRQAFGARWLTASGWLGLEAILQVLEAWLLGILIRQVADKVRPPSMHNVLLL